MIEEDDENSGSGKYIPLTLIATVQTGSIFESVTEIVEDSADALVGGDDDDENAVVSEGETRNNIGDALILAAGASAAVAGASAYDRLSRTKKVDQEFLLEEKNTQDTSPETKSNTKKVEKRRERSYDPKMPPEHVSLTLMLEMREVRRGLLSGDALGPELLTQGRIMFNRNQY